MADNHAKHSADSYARYVAEMFGEVGTGEIEIAPEIEANQGLFADTGDAGEQRYGNQLW